MVAEKFSADRARSTQSEAVAPLSEDTTKQTDDDDFWDEFEKKAEQYHPVSMGTSTTKAILEVQRFLDLERVPRTDDALKWWKENRYLFPHLACVAQERLSACVTSVACERQFSKAGLIISDRRNRISSKKTKMLLFLNTNLSACQE